MAGLARRREGGAGNFPRLPQCGLSCLSLFFWTVLGLCCCKLSLVMERRGYSLIVVPGFLLAVASLAAEHWL